MTPLPPLDLPLHVVLDSSKNWLEYTPPWVTAVAALITVIIAISIARRQNQLQKTLAEKQFEIQERQLKKDLFDRRFAVYTGVMEFVSAVLRENGKINLIGTGEYRKFCADMEKAEMLFRDDVNKYLADVKKTALELHVSAQGRDKAVATGDGAAIEKDSQLLEHLGVTLLQQRVKLFRPYLTL